jgi:hypothetical protein
MLSTQYHPGARKSLISISSIDHLRFQRLGQNLLQRLPVIARCMPLAQSLPLGLVALVEIVGEQESAVGMCPDRALIVANRPLQPLSSL